MRIFSTVSTLILGAAAAAGVAWWVQQERLDAAAAQVTALQQEVRTQSNTLLGYTRYTSYLTVGKESLSEQMKLLSATVVRDEGTTQIVEKSVLGLPSTGVVAISYTVEYAFGYDLRPESYELKAKSTLSRPAWSPHPPSRPCATASSRAGFSPTKRPPSSASRKRLPGAPGSRARPWHPSPPSWPCVKKA